MTKGSYTVRSLVEEGRLNNWWAVKLFSFQRWFFNNVKKKRDFSASKKRCSL